MKQLKNELPTIKDIVLENRRRRAKQIKNRRTRTEVFKEKLKEF